MTSPTRFMTLITAAGLLSFCVCTFGLSNANAPDSARSAASPTQAKRRPEPLKYLIDMVHHNPGEPLFITKYNRPHYLKQLGYNGDGAKRYFQCAITYDRLEPGLVSQDSATWAWIQRHAHNLDHLIEEYSQEGIPLYPFTDVLVVPMEVMDKYGSQMKDPKGRLSIRS